MLRCPGLLWVCLSLSLPIASLDSVNGRDLTSVGRGTGLGEVQLFSRSFSMASK